MPSLSRAAAAIVFAVLVAAAAPALQDTAARVEAVFNRIEESNGAEVWSGVRDLETMGPSAIPEIRKGLSRANPWPRVAAGKVLYGAEFRDEALEVLGKVVSSKVPGARRAAIELTASLTLADKTVSDKQRGVIADGLKTRIPDAEDDLTRVCLWRAIMQMSTSIEPPRAIREILDSSKDADAKDEAALALAEVDRTSGTVKSQLKLMAQQPGERGRIARAYLRLADAAKGYERIASGATKYDYKLLDEIIDKLKAYYYDPEKISEAKLIEAAARGMLASLDHHTAYYDEKTVKELHEEELAGHYGGIGARVAMRKDKGGTSWLTITEPIFSGPAYRAGLRSNDIISEVEGETTANREIGEIIRRLRGKPGTDVKIKVFRRGWPKEKEFTICRWEVQLDTTLSRMLPGKIGYINYTTFGDLDEELQLKGSNIETQLEDLKKQGMKALVLDLRGNGGGFLRTATRIASLFLKRGDLIVSTRARGEEVERYAAKGGPATEVPMYVLIDDGSASASEILSGALKDHKRAVVIGEKSYGKGSVQDLKPLDATEKKSAARITIAMWFLPGGKSVSNDDHKLAGVEPDIKVTPPERDYWKLAEFERLRADGKVDEYVAKAFEANKPLFMELAESDGGDPGRYPGLDALHASLETKLSKVDLRELVREYARSRAQDDRKAAFPLDYQTDVTLQRALLEACAKTEVNPATIKEYSIFAKDGAVTPPNR